MRIIGVLDSGCKGKHASGGMKAFFTFCCLVFAFGVIAFQPPAATAAQKGNTTMATPGGDGGAVIGTDPATGSRVMKTPDPKPQEESQGPQTVIIAPEVYPDRQGPRPRPPRKR